MLVSEKLLIKDKNTTYASVTPAYVIFNSFYYSKSLLVSLLNFNRFLNSSDYANSVEKDLCNFTINWDYTTECLLQGTDTNNIKTIFNNLNNFTFEKAANLYNIQYQNINIGKENIVTNSVYIPKNNIYVIIQYALEVYQDMLEIIQFNLANKFYCKKEYMNLKYIPLLFKLYDNFNTNQQKTIQYKLPTNFIANIKPYVIPIQTYVNEFVSFYLSSYTTQIFLKNVILNNYSSIVFFQLFGVPIYYYYYLTLNNPSPILLTNSWTDTSNYTSFQDFQSAYIASITYDTYNIINTYSNGGLWPNYGAYPTNTNNIGSVIAFYTNNVLTQYTYIFLVTTSDGISNNGSSLVFNNI